MPDEGQYDDSLLLRLRRLPMVRISHKIHISLYLYQYRFSLLWCLFTFFSLKKQPRENGRCEICVYVCCRSIIEFYLLFWPCCKYSYTVAIVVSFLIKVYTFEKLRVDQSLNLKIFWKKVPRNAKISSKLNSSAVCRPQNSDFKPKVIWTKMLITTGTEVFGNVYLILRAKIFPKTSSHCCFCSIN